MIQQFQQHLKDNFPFLKGKTIAVACSGGVDSMVLTHLLLQAEYTICLVHCNFTLRGEESDLDAGFVKNFGTQNKIPVFVKKFYTKKYCEITGKNTQLAARELRYAWFEEILNRKNADFLATGHHLDDNLETFMINLSRGTGLKGLLGIPPHNHSIFRPLLHFTREDILAYAKKNKISWRDDSSNQTTAYLRNKLRRELIGPWKKENPQLLQNFNTTLQHLRQTAELLEDYSALLFSYVVQTTEEGYRLEIAKLKRLPNLRAVLYTLLHPFGFTAWEDILHLLDAPSGKQVFSDGFVLLKDRDFLFLYKKTVPVADEKFFIKENTTAIETPITLTFESVTMGDIVKKNTIFVDAKKLKYPLYLRKWQEGDYFYPFGMSGKKKLSKFFKDEKLSLFGKQKIWLLCNADNQIIWVVNHRMDERFRIQEDTKKIIKIQLIQ